MSSLAKYQMRRVLREGGDRLPLFPARKLLGCWAQPWPLHLEDALRFSWMGLCFPCTGKCLPCVVYCWQRLLLMKYIPDKVLMVCYMLGNVIGPETQSWVKD